MSNEMTTAELEKIHSEIAKLMAETSKLNAETSKLRSEERKLSREALWYPLAMGSGLVGATAAATLALSRYLS
jgi:predicted nuclease with TOPRIM domain